MQGAAFFLLFSCMHVQGEPWAIYMVIQADARLDEPAHKALRDAECACKEHRDLRICVDIIKDGMGRRYLFSCEDQDSDSPKRITEFSGNAELLKNFKDACSAVFKNCEDRKTAIIFSGHSTGVLSPVLSEERQCWLIRKDEGNSPFSRYCEAQENNFWQKVLQMQGDKELLEEPLDQLALNSQLPLTSLPVIPSDWPILPHQQFVELVRWVSTDLLHKKIDIVGCDACSMASIELAYDLKDSAHYLIASQSLEEKCGWDYAELLSLMQREDSLHTLVRKWVYAYEREQRLRNVPLYSLAAYDLAAAENCTESVDAVAVAVTTALQGNQAYAIQQALFSARYKAAMSMHTIGILPYVDMGLFLELLYSEIDAVLETEEIAALKLAILDALESLQVLVQAHVSSPQAGLTGCLVYFPQAVIDQSYRVSWAAKHRWLSFLKLFVGDK